MTITLRVLQRVCIGCKKNYIPMRNDEDKIINAHYCLECLGEGNSN